MPGLGSQAWLGWAVCSAAALFASFIGGIHWGIGLRYMATHSDVPTFHFVWGPVPPYLAWGTLLLPVDNLNGKTDRRAIQAMGEHLASGTLLLPVDIALWLLVAVFVLAYVVDGRTWPGAGLGPWLSLRRQITAMVVACCVLAALALKVA